MSVEVVSDSFDRKREISRLLAAPALEGYEVVAYIGEGTYGDVWEARDWTQTTVAIKRFRREPAQFSCQEVEMLASLDDARGIVKIKDVHLDSHPYCYVMEYMPGGTLRKLLQKNGGKLPFAQAWLIFRELVDALAYVHRENAVHCDIKPENVLLDSLGRPRLSDFGQARSGHGRSLGTLFYMPPEQARLDNPLPQSDVYALGALLYEMLTGKRPRYDGDFAQQMSVRSRSSHELKQQLMQYARLLEAAPPPREHRKVRGVDRAVSDIIDSCLAADPDGRPKDAAALQKMIAERDKQLRTRPLFIVSGVVLPGLLMAVLVVVFAVGVFSLNSFSQHWQQHIAVGNQTFALAVASATQAKFDDGIRAVREVSQRPQLGEHLRNVRQQDAVQKLRGKSAFDTQSVLLPEDQQAVQAIQELGSEIKDIHKDTKDFRRWSVADENGASLYIFGVFDDDRAAGPDLSIFGDDFSWRGWFNGEIDLPRSMATVTTARDSLSLRLQLNPVFLTQPYQRESDDSAKRRWSLSISSVIEDGGAPLGVVSGQIDYERFTTFIRDLEQRVSGSDIEVNRRRKRNVIIVNRKGQTIYHPELTEIAKKNNGSVAALNLVQHPFFGEPFTWSPNTFVDPEPQQQTFQDPWNPTDKGRYFVGRARIRLANGQLLSVFVMESEDQALDSYYTASRTAKFLFSILLPLAVCVLAGNWFLFRRLTQEASPDVA